MAAETDAPASQERLRAAIGPRADYYLRRWREMDATSKTVSWNWAACFLHLYWFVFRKMWVAAAVFILANIVVSMVPAVIPIPGKYVILMLIGLTFITGGYGNLLYRKQIEKRVAGPATLEELRARGGTSPIALGISLALTVAATALVVVPAVRQAQAERAAGLRSP
ncbi:MAG: hypothetical protein QOH47_3121 [Sphingomonadales bacterium]|jgi:hypothetical protein|nr:hypothetical protein [Sphingomonadales bacterium]